MIGINRKDIQAILKAGAKAKGMSTSEFKAEIQATIDNIINSSDIEEQKRFKQYFGNRIPTPEEYLDISIRRIAYYHYEFSSSRRIPIYLRKC